MSEPPRPPKGATQLPPKREVAIALLQAHSVFVNLDPRHEQVRVPPWFKKQPRLVLQFGMNMAVPIRDLDVGEQALSGTLSFSRQPFFCYIPWQAVFALVNEEGRGMVWPDDVPPELVAQAEKQKEVAKRRSRLRAVAGPQSDASLEAAEAPTALAPADGNAGEAERADPSPPPCLARPQAKAVDQPATSSSGRSSPVAHGTSVPASADPASRPEPSSEVEPSHKKARELPPYLRVVK